MAARACWTASCLTSLWYLRTITGLDFLEIFTVVPSFSQTNKKWLMLGVLASSTVFKQQCLWKENRASGLLQSSRKSFTEVLWYPGVVRGHPTPWLVTIRVSSTYLPLLRNIIKWLDDAGASTKCAICICGVKIIFLSRNSNIDHLKSNIDTQNDW